MAAAEVGEVMNQLTLPGVGTSELESLLRDIAEAGRLNSVRVEHRRATTSGWKEGWFASVGYDFKPEDRGGRHPTGAMEHDLDDPVEALVKALRRAKEGLQP